MRCCRTFLRFLYHRAAQGHVPQKDFVQSSTYWIQKRITDKQIEERKQLIPTTIASGCLMMFDDFVWNFWTLILRSVFIDQTEILLHRFSWQAWWSLRRSSVWIASQVKMHENALLLQSHASYTEQICLQFVSEIAQLAHRVCHETKSLFPLMLSATLGEVETHTASCPLVPTWTDHRLPISLAILVSNS